MAEIFVLRIEEGIRSIDIVDLLRALSVRDSAAVLGRIWQIETLDVHCYGFGGFNQSVYGDLFTSSSLADQQGSVLVDGSQLLRGSALIHQTEECLLMRVESAAMPTALVEPRDRMLGVKHFLATNIDFEIRRDDGPFEVVTRDREIILHFQHMFPGSILVK
jgi:hypothetical protein